jgi:hypothetical protein
MYTTFLASCFRSIRFGLTEAHGRGIALQLNSLIDAGGFAAVRTGRSRWIRPRSRPASRP